MGRDLNDVKLIARLVKDPEIKYTANGTPVTKFSIANNQTFKQNNETKEYANYFDIEVWGNQAVSCEKYLKKGSQVAVAGSLKQERWQDQASGQTRSKVKINANFIQFLSPASNTNTTGNQQGQPPANQNNQNGNNSNPGVIQDPWGDPETKPNNNNFDPYQQPNNQGNNNQPPANNQGNKQQPQGNNQGNSYGADDTDIPF